ncbi:MAG: LysR family transcriptional regulator [Burkholderiaceae bacterium]|jgi:DNA-binding transcriptional LysR family regulator|nr:LysR family transcriptional regulator [Burkholderiaceae bacterium]
MLIRSLRSFLALHRYGTVVAAAENVHLSQAAVSVQLKNIEEELGVKLFERTKRSIEFTPAGHQLVGLAEQIVTIYEEMKTIGSGQAAAGTFSLGVINSALSGMLPRFLRQITEQNPCLEIKIVAGLCRELLAQVDRGTLDAAIVIEPPQDFPTALSVHHLYSEPYALITARNQPCDGVMSTLHSDTPYIAFEPSSWTGQMIEAYRVRNGVLSRPSMELNSLSAISSVVAQGFGMSIVPLIPGAAWHLDPHLRVVRLPDFLRPISLVARKTHHRHSITAALLSSFDRDFMDEPAAQAS